MSNDAYKNLFGSPSFWGVCSAVAILLVAHIFIRSSLTYNIGFPDDIPRDDIAKIISRCSEADMPDNHGIVKAKQMHTDIVMKQGESLGIIMQKMGIDERYMLPIYSRLRNVVNTNKLIAGQKISVDMTCSIQYIPLFSSNLYPLEANVVKKCYPKEINIVMDNDTVVSLRNEENFGFTIQRIPIKTHIKQKIVSGLISNSLYQDAVSAGVPPGIVLQIIPEYSFDIDFQRDIQGGDKFILIFEEILNERGEKIRNGKILFSKLVTKKSDYSLYQFNGDFYDSDGSSVKKALLRTPIDGARISSGFGSRKHPILGYTRMHQGVDFAAPSGTPIYAAGDGIVEYIGYKGGYGKFISIRHNSEYKTNYAHMRAFKNGLRVGMRIKQRDIVGYVGSTGIATGPHLHFEVMKHGSKVNPSKQRFASNKKISDIDKKRFFEFVRNINNKVS